MIGLVNFVGNVYTRYRTFNIIQERLLLLKEKGSLLEGEVSQFQEECRILTEKNIALELRIEKVTIESEELKKQILNFKATPTKQEYECPKCHEPTFKLVQNLPHPNKFFANSGMTVDLHKCEKCDYEKTM